jgi:tRNA dimethylallyltransferase
MSSGSDSRGAVFALLGPTASGKSSLALQLAERLPIEIVSVDSGQVYRGMDIGTAKPSSAERARVAHHLLDVVAPTERYSAGRFRDEAIAAVRQIIARGRMPLLVGGTMLYYRALAHGIDPLPAADAALRAEICSEAQRRGWQALHAELAKVDPLSAQRIMPNDAQRIQRALEVFRAAGRPISALHSGARAAPPFRLAGFALMPQDRAALHGRIARRFDAMLSAGLIAELEALRAAHALEGSMASMRCVGYRQVWEYLEGRLARSAMRERAIAATRQLAKRQMTWLRSLTEVELLDPARSSLADDLAARLGQG